MSELTLNDKVKKIRRLLNLSQMEFSKALGIKQGSLSDIERKKVNVSKNVEDRLIKKIGVSSEWLHTDNGEIFKEKFFIEKHTDNTPSATHHAPGKNISFPNPEQVESIKKELLQHVSFGHYNKNDKIYNYYTILSVNELEYLIGLKKKDLQEIIDNYNKVVEIFHKLKSPTYTIGKFNQVPFEKYYNGFIKEQTEEYWKVKQSEVKKILLLMDVESDIEHWNSMLTKILDYLLRNVQAYY
jgi:transcriptional regulator with XRE-family HTH domain